MKITSMFVAAAGSALVLSLAGCGGSDDNDPVQETPAVTAVPDSAGVSAAAFVSYLLTLDANDETSESLTISDTFAVPPEESADATPLI